MARTVDRSIAKMIAYKRLITGTSAIAAGIGILAVATAYGRRVDFMLVLALAMLFGGGAWALRDGLRLRRELRR